MRPVDQRDVDRRHVRESDHGVAGPIDAGHARPVELYFFKQHLAERLNDRPLDLILQRIRIHHEAAIVRTDDALHGYLAGSAIDAHLHRHRDIVFVAPEAYVGKAPPGQSALGDAPPARHGPHPPPPPPRRPPATSLPP